MSRRTKFWLSVIVVVAAAGGALWLVRSLPDDEDWTWDVLPERGRRWVADEGPQPDHASPPTGK